MPIDGKHSALREIGNALGSDYDQFRPFFRRYRNICQYCPFRQQYCWCSILIIGGYQYKLPVQCNKGSRIWSHMNYRPIGPKKNLLVKKSQFVVLFDRNVFWNKKKSCKKKKSSLRNFLKISYVTFLFVLDNVITEHLALGGKIFWAWFRQYVVEWGKAFYQ